MDFCIYISVLLFISSASATPLLERKDLEHGIDGALNNGIYTTEDTYGGFMVLFDYSQDLLIIKNTTTQTCFFSPLEKYDLVIDHAELTLGKGDSQNNFLVTAKADVAKTVLLSMENASIRLENLNSDVKVANQCVGRPSYWMVQYGGGKERRDAREGCGCCCCGCCCCGRSCSISSDRSE